MCCARPGKGWVASESVTYLCWDGMHRNCIGRGSLESAWKVYVQHVPTARQLELVGHTLSYSAIAALRINQLL